MYRLGPEGMKGGAEDDWAPHRDLLADDGTLELVFGGFLIRGAGDRVILVDGGVGPPAARHRGDRRSPAREPGRRSGVAPGDVTDVLFTHLHFDHIGWASSTACPRSRTRPTAATGATGTTSTAPTRTPPPGSPAIEPRLEPWDTDTTLAPGVDTRLAPGHTPGSTLLVLSSGDERALLLGDVVHCAVELVDDDWGGVVRRRPGDWRSAPATRSPGSSREPTCPWPPRTSPGCGSAGCSPGQGTSAIRVRLTRLTADEKDLRWKDGSSGEGRDGHRRGTGHGRRDRAALRAEGARTTLVDVLDDRGEAPRRS